MNKHNPGPWFVTQEYDETVVQWKSPHGTCYYITQAVGNPGPDGESAQANARLIAAAPDLLAALEYIFENGAIYSSAIEADTPHVDFEEWEVRARAAISKAKEEA